MVVKSTRTWWRWMQRPWVTAVLLLVLGADFARLYHANVGVGAAVRALVLREVGFAFQTDVQYFRREGSTLLPLFRDGDSADEFSKAVSTEPQNVLFIIADEPQKHGFWVPILKTNPVQVGWMDQSGVDDELRERVIKQFANDRAMSWERSGHPELAKQVRDFPLGSSVILWSGVIHNLAALVVGTSLFLSLGWLPRWARSLRRQPWQCRGCGYDLRGSDGGTCPECGVNQTG